MTWKSLSSIQSGFYRTAPSRLGFSLDSIKVTLAFETFTYLSSQQGGIRLKFHRHMQQMFLMIQPFYFKKLYLFCLSSVRKKKKIQVGTYFSVCASKLQPKGSSTLYPNQLYWFGVHVYFLWWEKYLCIHRHKPCLRGLWRLSKTPERTHQFVNLPSHPIEL